MYLVINLSIDQENKVEINILINKRCNMSLNTNNLKNNLIL